MTIAGDGLKYVDPLADVTEAERTKAIGEVLQGILAGWNNDARAADDTSAYDLISQWLGSKLNVGGRLDQVFETMTGLDRSVKGFRDVDLELPNPLACSAPSSPLRSIKFSPIVGRGHGDLHGRNILIHAPGGTETSFYLIDFEHYRRPVALLFDLAYLEISQFLSMRSTASRARWLDLVSVTARLLSRSDAIGASKHADDEGLIRFSGMIRDNLFSWQAGRFPSRREDVERQYRLACIAAGLNYASKRSLDQTQAQSTKLKEFAFLYAAQHLKELYQFERIALPQGEQMRSMQIRASDNTWREVWRAADSFNSARNAYVLVAGTAVRRLAPEEREAITRLPWSLVIDFDSASDGSSLSEAAQAGKRNIRGVHRILSSQSEVDVNFNVGVAWFMADGWQRVATSIPASTGEWRRTMPRELRRLATKVRAQTTPRPLTVVFLAEAIDPSRLRGVYAALTEQVENVKVVVVENGPNDKTSEILTEEGASPERIACRYNDLAIGISEMIGDPEIEVTIRIPARSDDSSKLTKVAIQPDLYAKFSESIELVHDGLARSDLEKNVNGPSFRDGAEVSWQDLNRSLDVPRDVTNEIRAQLTRLLDDLRAVAVSLRHKPGAGATTVVRRLAWDLRNLYPTILIKSFNNLTVDHIDTVSQLSGLPIFIVAEQARLLDTDRDRLFSELRSRNLNFVFLDVVRSRHLSPGGALSYLLEDQMVASEAQRFYERYVQWCAANRRGELQRLTTDTNLSDFRSPFFYSLYAFENKFNNVQDYVSAYFDELSDEQRELLAFLALISVYSQQALPFSSLKIMSRSDLPAEVRLSEVLGEAANKLVLFNGTELKIVHPRIAREILQRHLRPEDCAHSSDWKALLPGFCVQFIERIANKAHFDSEIIEGILTYLFIVRTEFGEERAHFSELVEDIPEASRRRVLAALCEKFDSNPHFWHHLGRLLLFQRSDSYRVAAECYEKAIALSDLDGTHHHGLGMVYRDEVRALIWPYLGPHETLNERLQIIKPTYQAAAKSFERARELSATDAYPRVSHIQMITRTIEELLKKSDVKTYSELLDRRDAVAEWCVQELSVAQTLVEDVRFINAERQPNRIEVEAAGKVDEFFDNFDSVVKGLTALLDRGIGGATTVRRSLARCYLRQASGNLSQLDQARARRVVELTQKNLAANPRSGDDLRLWIQAFRLLPEFTIGEAIERFSHWAEDAGAIDAWYYLYIFHFLNSVRGARSSLDEAKRYIERCRKGAPELVSKRSFEWIAADRLRRPCPLLNHLELGPWRAQEDLFAHNDRLQPQTGIIVDISKGTSGKIDVNGLSAFFAPTRGRLNRATYLNAQVTFYLGFSYEGLRAWNVQPSRG
ncbi:tetratricopeptide (TPR) repeat protein [Bradyrhizobium sp. USDA 4461]